MSADLDTALTTAVLPDIARHSGDMVALRREIHADPELGFDEHRTSERVAQRLLAWGYRVERGLGGTGVVGSLRCGSGPKRLGLRADMDALPIAETTGLPYASRNAGLMHACGHDGHTATLLAAARLLAHTRSFDGTLQLIFQPAEEGLGGAARMIEQGLFERFPCDAIYAFHNLPGYAAGLLGFRAGVLYNSSDTVAITVHGQGGHGAAPHRSVDPIALSAHLILALQTLVAREIDPNEFAVVTVGAIHAGQAPNVIPASAELLLTVRARSHSVREQLRRRITEMAHGLAATHRGRVEVDYRWRYPPVVNDAEATDFARQVALASVGAAGLIADLPAQHASDDFALMLDRVPGCYFVVGNGIGERVGEGGCVAHNANYDFNDAILPSTASYLVRLVQAYLR